MKLSIKKRIFFSFWFLVALFIINGVITIVTLVQNQRLSQNISNAILPSMQAMDEFSIMVLESKMYTTNWVFFRSGEEDKKALKKIHNFQYHALRRRLAAYTDMWTQKNITDSLQLAYVGVDRLMEVEKEIMLSLRK